MINMKGKRKVVATVSVKLPMQIIKEDNVYVAYCPALEIATQGETFEEAEQMFDELVRIFIEEAYNRGTLDKVLKDCGWVESPDSHAWEPPQRQLITETAKQIELPCPI